jgi:hypothetical protein
MACNARRIYLAGGVLWMLSLVAGCASTPDRGAAHGRATEPRPAASTPPAASLEPLPAPVVEAVPVPRRAASAPRTPKPEPSRAALPEAVAAPPPPPRGEALLALLEEAEDQGAAGDLDAAAATLERALRISPEDALAWHELARIRLSQKQPEQAGYLAEKSNSLAAGRPELQARNWRIIAVALQLKGETKAADRALREARRLEAAAR